MPTVDDICPDRQSLISEQSEDPALVSLRKLADLKHRSYEYFQGLLCVRKKISLVILLLKEFCPNLDAHMHFS